MGYDWNGGELSLRAIIEDVLSEFGMGVAWGPTRAERLQAWFDSVMVTEDD